jgi:hypothetical protein
MSAHMPERLFVIAGITTLRPRFLAAWKVAGELIKAGEPIEVIVRLRKSKRSVEQNKRYWALLREVSATVWIGGRQFSDEVWHEQFKRWFIGMIEMPDGTMVGISTTTLNVGEFGEYMTRIEVWCAEQGFPVMQEAA